ncbi:MAG: hypothetical protein IJ708_10415 [Clostridia bacterium]|nr:hypothetical protein [Clostridia bacterium]
MIQANAKSGCILKVWGKCTLVFFAILVSAILHTLAYSEEALALQEQHVFVCEREFTFIGEMPKNVDIMVQATAPETYDITMWANGKEFQPSSPVYVVVTNEDNEMTVLHSVDGEWEYVPSIYTGKHLSFNASHFSVYVLSRSLELSEHAIVASLLQDTDIPVIYSLNDHLWTAEQLSERYDINLPTALRSGPLQTQVEQIENTIREMLPMDVNASPEVNASCIGTAKDGDIERKRIQSLYAVGDRIAYLSSWMDKSLLIADTDEGVSARQEVVRMIEENQSYLHDAEKVVIEIAISTLAPETKPKEGTAAQTIRLRLQDSQDETEIEGLFVLEDAQGEAVWQSDSMGSSFIIDVDKLEEGQTYYLTQTASSDGYVVPETGWRLQMRDGEWAISTLSSDDDRAEELFVSIEDGNVDIRNERIRYLNITVGPTEPPLRLTLHYYEVDLEGKYHDRSILYPSGDYEEIELVYTDTYGVTRNKISTAFTNVLPDYAVSGVYLGNIIGNELVITRELKEDILWYSANGLMLGDERVDEFTGLQELICIYYPKYREIPLHIVIKMGKDQYEICDELRSTEVKTIAYSGTSLATTETNKKDVLQASIVDQYGFIALYYGKTWDEHSITEVISLTNRMQGFNVNDTDEYMSGNDQLFYVFYKSSRTVDVHLIEFTENGYEDRDIQWEVQSIEIPERTTYPSDYEVSKVLDDDYLLYQAVLASGINQLGSGKVIVRYKNSEDGLMTQGQTETKYRLDSGEIYYIYFKKMRTLPVVYAERNQSGIHVVTNLSESRVANVVCSTEESVRRENIGQPEYATVNADGQINFRPNYMFGLMKKGDQIRDVILCDTFPELVNSWNRIKGTYQTNGKKQTASFDLVPSIVVLYDNTLDTAPAYLRISNHTRDKQATYTFKLSVAGGAYTNSLIISSEREGSYVTASEGEYTFSLSPETSKTVYLPGAGNMQYTVRIFNFDGHEITAATMDESELQLGVQPTSD